MNENKQNSRREQNRARRRELITLSNNLRPLVNAAKYATINQAIKDFYLDLDYSIKEFHTFEQWSYYGFTIKKGSQAFPVWGQPRHRSQIPEGSEEPEEYKFWPLCYLFANTQVTKREEKEQPEPQRERHTAKAESLEDALID
jgi:hypothetical protein